jgi:hypothetical protein
MRARPFQPERLRALFGVRARDIRRSQRLRRVRFVRQRHLRERVGLDHLRGSGRLRIYRERGRDPRAAGREPSLPSRRSDRRLRLARSDAAADRQGRVYGLPGRRRRIRGKHWRRRRTHRGDGHHGARLGVRRDPAERRGLDRGCDLRRRRRRSEYVRSTCDGTTGCCSTRMRCRPIPSR